MLISYLDYLSGSLPKDCLSELQNNFLDCGLIKDRGIGFRGYHKSYYLVYGGRIAWSDDREEFHFDLPSKCLNFYFPNIAEIVKLLRFVLVKNGNISRTDSFIDAKGEHFVPMKVIERAVRNREYVSRTKNIYNKYEGETVYIGSFKSKKLLRIYNKAKQLKLKGEEITRFEMTHRDRYAKEFCKKLIEAYDLDKSGGKIHELIASTFRSWCDFVVVKGTCSTKWVQKRWWKKIVGNVKKFKFACSKIVKIIAEKTVSCFKKPVLRTINLVNEKFLKFMNEFTTSEDINLQHRRIIYE